jgi:hypothetical protein
MEARPRSGVVRRLPDEQLHAHFEKTLAGTRRGAGSMHMHPDRGR